MHFRSHFYCLEAKNFPLVNKASRNNVVSVSAFVIVFKQPSPNRREDRPVSFYQLGSNQLQPNVASLARDAANIAKDKQRGFMPSILQNETYGAILSGSPPPIQPAVPVTSSAPPLPPRNIGKGINTGKHHCMLEEWDRNNFFLTFLSFLLALYCTGKYWNSLSMTSS